MASIFNCWTCDKKLSSDREEDCFFWCSDEHQKQHFDKENKKRLQNQIENEDNITDINKDREVCFQKTNNKNTQKKNVYTCKVCHKPGHNSRSCKQNVNMR